MMASQTLSSEMSQYVDWFTFPLRWLLWSKIFIRSNIWNVIIFWLVCGGSSSSESWRPAMWWVEGSDRRRCFVVYTTKLQAGDGESTKVAPGSLVMSRPGRRMRQRPPPGGQAGDDDIRPDTMHMSSMMMVDGLSNPTRRRRLIAAITRTIRSGTRKWLLGASCGHMLTCVCPSHCFPKR
jgi:hypothetical protein